jgi:hypothetical protein
MDLKEIGCEDVDWILVQDRVQWQGFMNKVMILLVPRQMWSFLSS